MTKIRRILLTLSLILGGSLANLPPTPVMAASCDDVQFIFARGSGEPLGGASSSSWQTAIDSRLGSSQLQYSFYELGSQAQDGAQYPAVAVAGSLDGINHLLGAFISSGQGFEFGKSVLAGRNELKAYLHKVSSVCPSTKFVLGGYSQGAMLLSGVLGELDATKIAYVATFGDPKLYLPEGAGVHPAACLGRDLSPYRAYVPDCHAYEGVLGSYVPYQTSAYTGKIGTWCNGQDMMCSSGASISDHTAYVGSGLYRNAATTIVRKLRAIFPDKFASSGEDVTASSPNPQDLVLIWDGRLSGLQLELGKQAARRLAAQTYAQGGRVAFYQFGYHWNHIEPCQFPCPAEKVYHLIDSRKTFAADGSPELALMNEVHRALQTEQWQLGATKTMVIISQDPIDYTKSPATVIKSVVDLSLKIDPVNIYSFASQVTSESRLLPDATNGGAYTLEQVDAGISAITERPAVQLPLTEYLGQVGDTLTFDASTLDVAFNLPPNLRYDWDLDADGIFEIQDGPAVIDHLYNQPQDGYIQVKLTDAHGYFSTMSARLRITEQVSALPTLEITARKLSEDGTRVDFVTDAPKILVVLDDAVLGPIDATVQQHITIGSAEKSQTLRLIPYNAISKGQAVETVISSASVDLPNADPDQTETPEAQTPAQTPPSNPMIPVTIAPVPVKKPAEQPAAFIPKVPNTGVRPE